MTVWMWRCAANLGMVAGMLASSSATAVDKLDMRDRDTAVAVCHSPYRFASGGWLLRTPVPAGAERINRFSELAERARQQRLALVDQLGTAADPAAESPWTLLVRSARAEPAMAAARQAALQALLPAIEQVKRPEHVVELLHQLSARGVPVWLEVRAEADPGAVGLHPTVLSLGDPAHYLDASDAARELLGRYRSYIEELLTAAGTAEVGSASAWVIDFEIKLAFAFAQSQSAAAWPASVRQLHKRHRHLQWNDLFKAIEAEPKKSLQVHQAGLFDAFDALIESAPAAQWRAWMRYRVLHTLASGFDQPFRKPYEDFFGGVLGQIGVPVDARDRLLAWSEAWFRPELAQRYLQTQLPTARASAAQQLFNAIKSTLAARIDASSQLDEPARKAARARLDAVVLAGLEPTAVRSFDGLHLSAENLTGNLLALRRWQQQRLLRGDAVIAEGLLAPVLRAQPGGPRIQLAAATLQPPLFDETAEPGLQYAGLGSLLARAMLQLVMAPADASGANANAAAQALWASSGLAGDSLPPDAADQLELDVQALALAHAAWLAAGVDRALPKHDGHTPEQRFFLAWAALWRENRSLVVAPERDPQAWRVDLALFQQADFVRVFACAKASPAAQRATPRIPAWP